MNSTDYIPDWQPVGLNTAEDNEKVHLLSSIPFGGNIHRQPTVQPHPCVAGHSRNHSNNHLFLQPFN